MLPLSAYDRAFMSSRPRLGPVRRRRVSYNPYVFVRSLESLSIDAMGTNLIRVDCEVTRDSIMPLLSATTFPFPGRTLAALALPAGMLVTLGALAAIGTPPLVIAINQKLKGDDVSIDYAFLPKDGTIAIFAGDARGHMGKEPKWACSARRGRSLQCRCRAEPFAQVWH